jgi:glyceraldehyde 3-phosphate dehydrogenase
MGRIGRATFKILMDWKDLELVAVNDLLPADQMAYLLNYDSVYGRYDRKVTGQDGSLALAGKKIAALNIKNPAELPWKEMKIDLVFECTGVFTKVEDLKKHIQAGARQVILSAPAKEPEILTVVHGVNRAEDNPQVISCASCTTNCITPVVEIMSRRIGIKKMIMTTVHAYTSSQELVDGPSGKWRRGRAAAVNIVPASTGAAAATTKALPEHAGKFDGTALRVPVPTGSISDITFLTARPTTVEEVNRVFREEAEDDRYRGVLGVTEEPIVSSDIVQDPRASIISLDLTRVVDGDLVKVMAWYDNEWGYSMQMVKEAARMLTGWKASR